MDLSEQVPGTANQVEIRVFYTLRQATNAQFTHTDTLTERKDALGFLTVKYAASFEELVDRIKEFSDMPVFFNYVLLYPNGNRTYTRQLQLVKKHLGGRVE